MKALNKNSLGSLLIWSLTTLFVLTARAWGQGGVTADTSVVQVDPLKTKIEAILEKVDIGTREIVAARVMLTGRPARVIAILESSDLNVFFRDGEEAGAIALVRLKSKMGFDNAALWELAKQPYGRGIQGFVSKKAVSIIGRKLLNPIADISYFKQLPLTEKIQLSVMLFQSTDSLLGSRFETTGTMVKRLGSPNEVLQILESGEMQNIFFRDAETSAAELYANLASDAEGDMKLWELAKVPRGSAQGFRNSVSTRAVSQISSKLANPIANVSFFRKLERTEKIQLMKLLLQQADSFGRPRPAEVAERIKRLGESQEILDLLGDEQFNSLFFMSANEAAAKLLVNLTYELKGDQGVWNLITGESKNAFDGTTSKQGVLFVIDRLSGIFVLPKFYRGLNSDEKIKLINRMIDLADPFGDPRPGKVAEAVLTLGSQKELAEIFSPESKHISFFTDGEKTAVEMVSANLNSRSIGKSCTGWLRRLIEKIH